ncbi:ABC transporter permease [Halococcus thailandensis]|uniref:Putative dipeptides/oligopeptides ABC transporter permease n=1 Tax=Halococcus thailandensis JCM 13552 TaxID=1227457 RepID=M0MSH6_9EURY|nr:ABC transporter permease [Halococcus thailandensis]EMA48541.1 putative dipeptides/oligopeptides ABC transporter permease [Halococcus thailandensis JCM 13552]
MGSVSPDSEADQNKSTTAQRSLLQQFWKNYKNNYLSIAGGAIILLLVLMALLAPILAPHSPYEQFETSDDSKFHPAEPGTEIILTNGDGDIVEQTTAYLGTDNVGRDILSRLLYGLRTTLVIGLSVVITSLVIGSLAGAIAGFYQDSWIDNAIMRVMDVIFPFPSIVLAIALLGVVGIGETTYSLPILGTVAVPNTAKIILVISVVYIPRFARVMRGAVVTEMEEDYIDALRTIGASDFRILLSDVIVNTVPSVVIQGSLYVGTALLASAGLSFLGLGIQPPQASLGLMLSNSRDYVYSGEWWFSVFPGLLIAITILGFNLLGDGLRDALDPRYQGEQ